MNNTEPKPAPADWLAEWARTPQPVQQVLDERHRKAEERRFDGAPLTGFGGL